MHNYFKDFSRRALNLFFCRIENRLLKKKLSIKYPVLFIVGPPRTGSTLLYQLITRKFEFSYFSNIMMGFPKCPGTISFFLSRFNGCTPPDVFNSKYGEISGRNAPSQGYKAWNRWFPEDQSYVGKNKISEKTKKEISNTISLVQNSFNMPFINKWQGHAVRIFPIVESIPNVLFLRIKRDMSMTAQSILGARRKFLGDENNWMSTKPREYHQIKDKSPIDQVCEQVYYLEKNLNEDISQVGSEKFLIVEYKDLCMCPGLVLDSIFNFVKEKASFCLKNRFSVPDSFEYDEKIEVSDEDFIAIKKKLNSLDS